MTTKVLDDVLLGRISFEIVLNPLRYTAERNLGWSVTNSTSSKKIQLNKRNNTNTKRGRRS